MQNPINEDEYMNVLEPTNSPMLCKLTSIELVGV